MKKETWAKLFLIAESVWILLMLVNSYWLGVQLKVPYLLLILPLAVFVGNTWALLKTKKVWLFFLQVLGLLLLFSGSATYILAALCLIPVIFVPNFFSKKWLKPLATVIVIMMVTMAGVSAYILFTADAPVVAVEQSYPQGSATLEVRNQTVTAEVGPETLRGVYFEKSVAGCTFTRLLYACTDDRKITLSWADTNTAVINGQPCSVWFSRLISE
jgi:hypothetical protein